MEHYTALLLVELGVGGGEAAHLHQRVAEHLLGAIPEVRAPAGRGGAGRSRGGRGHVSDITTKCGRDGWPAPTATGTLLHCTALRSALSQSSPPPRRRCTLLQSQLTDDNIQCTVGLHRTLLPLHCGMSPQLTVTSFNMQRLFLF